MYLSPSSCFTGATSKCRIDFREKMLGNAYFGSIYRENRWTLSIGTYFSKEHHVLDIDIETTTCVFRLPRAATRAKPEAYAPRRLALGPYHHLRPDSNTMQLHKISRVRRFLGADKLDVFKKVVAALVQCEPLVRACYDDFLDFDVNTLATILAVDALYLLHCFFDAGGQELSVTVQNAGDILMLENQIPLVLLNLILKILHLCEIVGADRTMEDLERELSVEFLQFCRQHSPLELTEPNTKYLHLLDFMYCSIVTNGGADAFDQIEMGWGFVDNVKTAAPPQLQETVERAKKIRELLKCGGAAASDLSESAGVRFERTAGGIMDILYDGDGNCLQLPRIRIDANTEIVLRNLVAYEASARRGQPQSIGEYVHLMCGLIHGTEDVAVLKQAGIIVGAVSEEEIVNIFAGMRRSAMNITVAGVEELSKSYKGVGYCVGRFVKNGISLAWKVICLLAAVAAVVLLVVQAFCSMFACGRWGVSSSAAVQSYRILYSQ